MSERELVCDPLYAASHRDRHMGTGEGSRGVSVEGTARETLVVPVGAARLRCWLHEPARVAHFRTVRPTPVDENERGQNVLPPESAGKRSASRGVSFLVWDWTA